MLPLIARCAWIPLLFFAMLMTAVEPLQRVIDFPHLIVLSSRLPLSFLLSVVGLLTLIARCP